MKTKNEAAALKQTILLLEHKEALQLKLVQEQFKVTLESLKPANLVKSAFNNISSSPDIQENVLDSVIGLTTGYLTKKVFVRSSHNPIKRIIGTVLEFVVARTVSKHTESIKLGGKYLIQSLLNKAHSHNKISSNKLQ